MNIIIVGAGAVGVVYGRHLQMAGHAVTFYVRPKYADEVREGLDIYHLNKGRHGPPQRFEGFDVLSSLEEVAARSWDQLWLCVSSPALKKGWLEETIEAAGEATVVGLQPGAQDMEYALKFCPADRLVWGLITFISYQAPLPGEERGSGFAYWLPPMTPNLFFGDERRGKRVAKALKDGGCPARYGAFEAQTVLGGASFIPLIAALEGSGWSFKTFKAGPLLPLSTAAARQAVEVVARQRGLKVPLLMKMVRPWMVRLALSLSRYVLPLPLEVYLEVHFTKVGDQTRAMLRDYVSLGKGAGLPTERIEALSVRLLPAEASQ